MKLNSIRPLAAGILLTWCLVAPRCDAAPNWDLRKLAVAADASSSEKRCDAELAFDDDVGTRWSSAWSNDQWISIDLGQPRAISTITLNWETAYASEYALEVSDDGSAWKEIEHVSDGKEGEKNFVFDNLLARYVRIFGIRRATQWGFSLREFIVRGPADGVEPEFGGLVHPSEIVTLFDHDWANLGRMFTAQCAQDPANSASLSDDEFLDLLEKRAFDYFWYEVHPESLFVVDSTTWKVRTSNAGIGYQLGSYIVGHYRNYRPREEIYDRVEKLLDHCWDDPDDPNDLCIEHFDGWTYHWVDIETGKWKGEEVVCTHDCITYLCGVIAAKHYFAGTRAGEIAGKILDGVKWDWIIHGGRNDKFVSNCFAPTFDPPCGGDVRLYDGMKFDYLFPIGGETGAIDPAYWHNYALDFPWASYNGHFWRIERPAPWCHQWDHVWFDFRNMKDDYTDYHQNSVEAMLANRQWCIDHKMYDADLWGVGPSHGPAWWGGTIYGSYGAPPDDLPFQKGVDNDGTISPTATLPGLVFAPQEAIRVARFTYDRYKDVFWKRYGFPDALNPAKNWFDREYISIDEGPIVINIENYRSRLIYNLFEKEPLVWNGLRRAGFMGIVDNFDPSEHSPAYGMWYASGTGMSFMVEGAGDCVKEGQRALKVRYDVSSAGDERFFAVRPDRKDFSPYRFLSFWVCRDPGLKPVLVNAAGQPFPLAESACRVLAQQWSRRYFEIPEAARTSLVEEVRFVVTNAAGVCWLDGILLTHEIPPGEPDFVIDDFEGTRATWSPGPVYRTTIVTNAGPEGGAALRVDYAKSGEGDRGDAIVVKPVITNWSRFHSVALWARGSGALRLRLADGAGRAFDVDTYELAANDGWKHVFFNIQANLNPKNCWEPRYDKRDIREMQFLVEPGKTDCAGTLFLSSIILTE